jgi:hypothetical protein
VDDHGPARRDERREALGLRRPCSVGELPAIEAALRDLSPTELVLIQLDAVDTDLAYVRKYLEERQRA